MGIFSKLFKVGAKDVIESPKIVKNVGTEVVKTTSTFKSGVSSILSGGKSFLSGAGSNSKFAGKVISGTGIVAIPTVAGITLWDKAKDVFAYDEEQRKNQTALDQAQQQLELTRQEIELYKNAGDAGLIRGGGDSGGLYYNPLSPSNTGASGSSSGGMSLLMVGLLVAAGVGGTYFIVKKKRK